MRAGMSNTPPTPTAPMNIPTTKQLASSSPMLMIPESLVAASRK